MVLPDVDATYHGRRVLLTVRDYPRAPAYDSYVDHPDGGRIMWPVGYDLLLASVGRVLGGPEPSREFVLGAASLAVPVLGALTALLAAAASLRMLRDRAAALWAGLFLAFMPAHLAVSEVGMTDHHVIEPLLGALAFLAVLAAARESAPRRRAARAVLAGGLLAGSFWFWTGFLMYLGPLALWIALEQARNYGTGRRDAAFDAGVLGSLAVAAALIVPIAASERWGGAWEMEYSVLSGFHVLALWGALLGAAILPALGAAADRTGLRRGPALALAAALGTAALGGIAALSPALRATTESALLFLRGGSPQILSAGESLPLFHGGRGAAVALLTGNVLLFPVLALAAAADAARPAPPGAPRREWGFFLCWLGVMAAFAFQQRRFTPAFSFPFAILLGWTVARGLAALRTERGAARLARAALALAALAAFVPALRALRPPASPVRQWEYALLRPTLDWLRTATPSPGDPNRPGERPAYSVFMNWNFGHWLIFRAERPAVSTPFGQTPWHDRAKRRCIRIMAAEEEGPALETLAEVGARYYVATPLHPYLSMLQAIWDGEAALGFQRPAAVAERLPRWLDARLLLGDPPDDGRDPDGNGVPSFSRFRLVRESPEEFRYRSAKLGWDFRAPYARVYEIVPGARLAGACAPGEAVRAEVPMRSNLGRTLLWRSREEACPDSGAFSVTVPYPTAGAAPPPGSLETAGPATVRAGAREARVEIPEEATRTGAEVRVPL